MDAFTLKKGDITGGAYLLKGDDGFLKKTAEKVFRSLLPDDSLSLYVFDRINDVKEITSCLGVYNFDGTPNVVLVKDTEKKFDEKDHKILSSVIKAGFTPDVLVFFGDGNLTTEKKLLTEIDCSRPNKYRCLPIVRKLFPCGIEENAADLLVDYTDCDLAKIENESFKLLAYCDGRTVTVKDVENLVAEDREIKSFAFASNVIAKNKVSAMKILEKMRRYGESNASILSSLSSQFQRMLYCSLSSKSDEELAVVLRVKPYAVKMARQNKNISKKQLIDVFSMLLEYEYKFKSGVMSDETALNLALGKLLG